MIKRIVVGTDGSDTADHALAHAIEVARRFEAKLHVVSAYRPLSGQQQQEITGEHLPGDLQSEMGPRQDVNLTLKEAVGKAKTAGVDAEAVPVEGDPVSALLDTAENLRADLIVVGNRGMKGARRLLGSVPNNVTHNAPCGVYIVNTTG